jgi:anti-sigma28 factor (negative regulator of flagellin synthesis)
MQSDRPVFSTKSPNESNVQSSSNPVQIHHGAADTEQAMNGLAPTGEGTRDVKISEIQQMIGRGEYHVEPSVIADAILRRLAAERMLPVTGLDGAQPACS